MKLLYYITLELIGVGTMCINNILFTKHNRYSIISMGIFVFGYCKICNGVLICIFHLPNLNYKLKNTENSVVKYH